MDNINGKTVKELINAMNLEEKASLCSGENFWELKGLKNLGIPSIMVTDGPHGLRKQKGDTDHVGLSDSVPATCFPTAVTLASSWDIDLLKQIGSALGLESRKENVAVLLGPGVNIKRSPLCGRNFEYFSEDPHLSGELASAFITGVQSHGVGTSLKHYAGNNQEYFRMTGNSVIDERCLREIYLPSFETAVKEAQPWTVMCSYNKLNGTYLSENNRMLNSILREEWGFEGLVVTDWGAANDRVPGIEAGLDLEMPGSGGINDRKIIKAVNEGRLDEAVLDTTVERVLNLILKALQNTTTEGNCPMDEQHRLAGRAAEESMVLLKNNNSILPLEKKGQIAVIGEFAEEPRYQGSGSSLINPWKLDSFLDEIGTEDSDNFSIIYAKGWTSDGDNHDKHQGVQTGNQLIDEALETAESADAVIFFAGLPLSCESEGFDRTHLRIPENQISLLRQLHKTGKKIIVVLQNGAPVEMPWLENCDAVIESYLGGQAGSGAVKRIIFGEVNPSGKLAESFPLKLEDCASTAFFPGTPRQVEYRESLYVGYRWFDSASKDVLFPFGFGLSYTTFEYGSPRLSAESIKAGDELHLSLDITNSGSRPGAEVVQLYVRDCESTVFRPDKELKGFTKLNLKPGETQTAEFTLDKRSFAFYDTDSCDWQIEGGDFDLLIGASSRDIRCRASVKVESDFIPPKADRDKLKSWYQPAATNDFAAADTAFAELLGGTVPVETPVKPYNINSTMSEIRKTITGRIIYAEVKKRMLSQFGFGESDDTNRSMVEHMVEEMPLRSIVLMGGGIISFERLEGLIDLMNGSPLRGIIRLMKKER